MMKVAINGLGGRGRAAMKFLDDTSELDPVAANDPADGDLLKVMRGYDNEEGYIQQSAGARGGYPRACKQERLIRAESAPRRVKTLRRSTAAESI